MTTIDTHDTHEPRSAETHPLFWSIRREVWESRSIYIAPLIVAGIVVLAMTLMSFKLPSKMRNLENLTPAQQHSSLVRPIDMSPAPIMFTALLVGFFFSIDALYGERRDRSILFWKSLPVSDRTVVLSKFLIPFAVLPAIALALSIVVHTFLMFAGSAILLLNGFNPGRLWAEVRYFEGLVIMFYGLAVHALWFAPVYGLLLLISAWAKRGPFLWVFIPMVVIGALERMTFGTKTFAASLAWRFRGAMHTAFATPDGNYERLSQLTPIRFFTTPGLWMGLFFAALCVAATIRIRRNREPI